MDQKFAQCLLKFRAAVSCLCPITRELECLLFYTPPAEQSHVQIAMILAPLSNQSEAEEMNVHVFFSGQKETGVVRIWCRSGGFRCLSYTFDTQIHTWDVLGMRKWKLVGRISQSFFEKYGTCVVRISRGGWIIDVRACCMYLSVTAKQYIVLL